MPKQTNNQEFSVVNEIPENLQLIFQGRRRPAYRAGHVATFGDLTKDPRYPAYESSGSAAA